MTTREADFERYQKSGRKCEGITDLKYGFESESCSRGQALFQGPSLFRGAAWIYR